LDIGVWECAGEDRHNFSVHINDCGADFWQILRVSEKWWRRR